MTTPSQTVGPYLQIGLPWPDGSHVVPAGTPGRIRPGVPSGTTAGPSGHGSPIDR